MAFFEILRTLNLQPKDEVIILGFTCSVMADAIIRIGALPIFVDVDEETFGSNPITIQNAITDRTKVIVAQHSFGIPCKIEEIVKIAKVNNIFLIEDCALTLGSKSNGVVVGNFGDVAIFSTDHSKPINTILGGLAYSSDLKLLETLREERTRIDDLTHKHQVQIWKQLIFERKWQNTRFAHYLGILQFATQIMDRIMFKQKFSSAFLIEHLDMEKDAPYPYPARLPSFLAQLGLIEIQRWPFLKESRKCWLQTFLEGVESFSDLNFLPSAYLNANLEIVPLRIAWSEPSGKQLRSILGKRIDSENTWFLAPIVATSKPLISFNYRTGACPKSESLAHGMINVPYSIDWRKSDYLLEIFEIIKQPKRFEF
jgi:dTDP-4-amino-4,6-dideoxygalactose transaminase